MPNIFDAQGLQVQTRDELLAKLTTAFQQIYGADVNLASSTPDGQLLNIFIQEVLDLQDLLVAVNDSFDPDKAIGVILDARVAFNGVQRQAGTYTITPITVVNSQSVNLYGLDQTAQQVFTVADNAGNQWQLVASQLGVTAGSHVYSFRGAVPGAQLTIPNTITVPVTIVLGVTSVNNPSVYSTLGVNEESDALLRIRRQKSVSLASQGYQPGLIAALQNVAGVTGAYVYENITGATDIDGVPGHSIWVIVSGTGAPADIAQAIFTKRNAGAGMFGSQTYDILLNDGSYFTVRWDTVITRSLYARFTATSINGVTPPALSSILAGLPTVLLPDVYSAVNVNTLATYIQTIDPNTLVTLAGFSDARIQTANLSGVPASGTFQLVYGGAISGAINWNDAAGTIQTKLQAMAGLSAATVTGSLASQSLVFNLSNIGDVANLLYTQTNTLQTSGPVAIAITWDENFQATLAPISKQNQFVLTSAHIIALAMQLKQSATTVPTTGQATFSAVGGYSARYTYSMQANPSGGSVNSTTGVYTAGGSANTTDIVKVTDAFGNTATASIGVV